MSRKPSFYVVWNFNRGAPTVHHRTAELALAEATRLAGENPREDFFVLESVACAMRTEVAVEWHGNHDDIPF
jgi:hypothetical protein